MRFDGPVSGLLSCLPRVGVGFVIVPAPGRYTNLPARSVVATSLAVKAQVSVGSIGTAIAQDNIGWQIAVPLAFVAAVVQLLQGHWHDGSAGSTSTVSAQGRKQAA